MLFANALFANSKNGVPIEMQKLIMAYRTISSLYVDDVDEAKIVEESIISMLEELDPHSSYTSAEDVKKMNEPLQGNFDGIGIQFNVLNDTLIVTSPIAGGPSEKVGIRAGDRIIKVGATTIAGVEFGQNKMVELLRGKKGTKVKVEVKRKGENETLTFTITRDKIPIYSIGASYMASPNIGYIKIDRFAASTYKEFMEAIFKLKEMGMQKLILDLQNNAGGYMKPAIEITDQLLSSDKLIVYTEGRKSPKQNFTSQKNGTFEDGGLVVLVDEGSASASEILAGAIQDWDRGLIVGRRTFGKGLVQKPFMMPDGSMIRLTVARYHTPTGRYIQKPYVKGEKEEYNTDLMHRYDNGEMVNIDSINFPDSLKYRTLIENRIVYGGGGITPDIFIPIDTTSYSEFHGEVVSKGVLNDFMLNYTDKNRDALSKKYKDFETFNSDYSVTEDIFQELVAAAAKDSIEYDEKEFAVSHDYLFLQIKALIARDLFDMSEYYQIMNLRNESFTKAIELLNEN